MDVFAPDVGFDAEKQNINGQSSLINSNIPITAAGATGSYVYDPNGVPRNPQSQGLATSLGLGAVAPYVGGVALGAYAAALANACTSVGFHARATVYSSVALGDQASALAHRTIAIGRSANATGVNAIAIGALAESSSLRTIAIGNAAQASSLNAIAIGFTSLATGLSTIALGTVAQATGQFSISIGESSRSPYNFSVAFGREALTVGPNQFVAGSVTSAFSDVWFGKGASVDAGVVPIAAWTLHGEEAFGFANQPGGALNLAGGRSTGTGIGGVVNIQTSDPGVAGANLNPLITRMTISSTAITATGGASFVGNFTGGTFTGSSLLLSTPFNQVAISIQHTPITTLGTAPTIRLHGKGASYEILNGAATANWYFGLDDDAGNSCVIGKGYGTGQGVPPAIRIAQDNTVTMIGPLVVTGNIQTLGGGVYVSCTTQEANLVLSANAGQGRSIRANTAGSLRWYMVLGDGVPESGANGGSAFGLFAYSDAGAYIDTVIYITRAAGGGVQINRPTTVTGTFQVQGSSNFLNGGVNVYNSIIAIRNVGDPATLYLISNPGVAKNIVAQTPANGLRWQMILGNTSPETGGNVGSDFQLWAYDDAGAGIDAPIGIVRGPGGAIYLSRPCNIGGSTNINGNLNVTGTINGGGSGGGGVGSVYAPVFTPLTNISAATGVLAWFVQAGSTVQVQGYGTITTIGPGAISFNISIPVASAFTALNQGHGQWRDATVSAFGDIQSNNSNGTMNVIGSVTGVGSVRQFRFSFSYTVV